MNKQAIKKLKELWADDAERKEFLAFSDKKVLQSLALIDGDKVTNAGAVLLAKKEVLDRYLGDTEIIFEWRQVADKTHYDYRENFRDAFLLIFDRIWEMLNNRNLIVQYQEGFIRREILAFQEKSIREAVLNAVTHRDYLQRGSSIWIKASPESVIIESPGGFLPGITEDNILTDSKWRNRKLAETFEKAGLVERAGQGLNDIYEDCIRNGKGVPSFQGSDAYKVKITIPAQVKDTEFVKFLEKVANEKQISFSFEEIFELELSRKGFLLFNQLELIDLS